MLLPILESTDRAALKRLLDRTPDDHGRLEPAVKEIVTAVRTRGDRALVEYARRFDALDGPVELSPAEIHAGAREEVHGIVAATGPQQRQVALDALFSRLGVRSTQVLHESCGRREARGVLIHVVRRAEEMRDARPRDL